MKGSQVSLDRFLLTGLVLLFISGCWIVGGMIAVPKHEGLVVLRTVLLTTDALANISFLLTILTSVLGMAGITDEDRARRTGAWLFVGGIAFLIVSVGIFTASIVFGAPWLGAD